MLAWSEGTDNGTSENQKSGGRHCRRRAIYWLLDHPRKLVTLNPKASNQQAPDATGFFPLVGCLPQATAWKTSSKSQDAVALQRIKERGALPMIDRGDIRQAIDRCSNIWASLPGAGYGQFEHGLTAWLQNSKKRAERSERLMYGRVTAIILALVICIIVCLSWAVNHYRDNAGLPCTTKCQRTESWRTAITDMPDASAWCCCARCKYTKELADAKAENDALRDDVAAGRRRLHIKAVCRSVHWSHHRLRRG